MRRPLAALSLAALAVLAPSLPAMAQDEPQKVLESNTFGLNISAINAKVAQGDAAPAAGNLAKAKVDYDQARLGAQNLTRFYRNLSGSFRGLDARIPREMDQKGREALETMAQANLRLAAVFRRQNQPEVAVPLLVEVVKVMTPASPEGRKAFQSLVEIGFAATPYTAGAAATPGS